MSRDRINMNERQNVEEITYLLNSIVTSSNDAIIAKDINGIILSWNEGAERIYGYTAGEIIGRPISVLLPPEQPDEFPGIMTQLRAGERIEHYETRRIRKDGRPILVSLTISPIKDAAGNAIGASAIARDITERKHGEEALQKAKDFAENVIQTANLIFLQMDTAGNVQRVNTAAEDITGYSRAEVEGKNWFEVLVPRERYPHVWDEFLRITQAGEMPEIFENPILAKQGVERQIIWKNSVLREGGKIVGTISFGMDITDRKRAEEVLETQAQVLQNMVEGVCVTGEGVHITFTNPRFDAMFGYERGELIGKHASILNHCSPEESAQLHEEIAQRHQTGLLWEGEFLSRKKDGTLFVTSARISSMEISGKNCRICVQEDITERKRAEEEVLLQKARFQSLFENAPIGIVMLDEKDRILRINRAFGKMFDYSIDEIQGRPINDVIVPPDLAAEAAEISAKGLRGGPVEIETTRQRKDGTRIPVHILGVPLMSKETATGAFAVYVDLTESKELAYQLRQAQKMEAVGRLAGGVAHDFNNLLTAIIGYSQLALGRLGENNPISKNVEEVIKAGERAARLIGQLLAFSRKQILQSVILNLNMVVSDMDKMLRRLIGEDIELIIVLDPHVGCVKADSDQISQIIMNLAVNSRDAMPHGGKLVIETSEVEFDEGYCKRHSGAKVGHFVKMAISDNGCGMDQDTLSHVFEPFFTTKERGKGTGLGLSTVYGIVNQSGGYIEVKSEPNVGSTFWIYLPRVYEESKPSTEAVEQSNRGTETLLVVEDEEGVRNLVREILEMNGYTVLEAGDADEAMGVFAQHESQIALLLADVIMPRKSGAELAKQLKLKNPSLKVLFMSGYTDDALTHQGVLNSDTVLIQKPFTAQSLAQKVRELLDT